MLVSCSTAYHLTLGEEEEAFVFARCHPAFPSVVVLFHDSKKISVWDLETGQKLYEWFAKTIVLNRKTHLPIPFSHSLAKKRCMDAVLVPPSHRDGTEGKIVVGDRAGDVWSFPFLVSPEAVGSVQDADGLKPSFELGHPTSMITALVRER